MFGTWGFFVRELSWAMEDNDNPLWFLSPGACSTRFLLWQPEFSRNWCAFLGDKTDLDWDSLVSTPHAPFSVPGIIWMCFSWNGQMNSDYCTFLSCCMQNHLQWRVGSESLFQEKLRHLYYFWLMTFSSFTVMLNIYTLLNYNPSLNSYFNFLVIVNKGNSKSYSCLALFSRNHIKVSIISVLKIKKYILYYMGTWQGRGHVCLQSQPKQQCHSTWELVRSSNSPILSCFPELGEYFMNRKVGGTVIFWLSVLTVSLWMFW